MTFSYLRNAAGPHKSPSDLKIKQMDLEEFMNNAVDWKPVVEQCNGCENITDAHCRIWITPSAKWRIGKCPSATHMKVEIKAPAGKVRVGQQKQKKK